METKKLSKGNAGNFIICKEMQKAFGLISRFDTTKKEISELSDVSRNYPTEKR